MKCHAAFVLLLVLSTSAFAQKPESFDWPQWQGPDRNAISKERELLQEWPKNGPPLVWELKDIGGGYSAPSIAAGRIFGMSGRGGNEFIWALTEADGKQQWATRLRPVTTQTMQQGQEGPGCTPTVDEERVYVMGMAGDLTCLQVADGKVIWQRSVAHEFGARMPTWSYRESPLIDGEKIICTPGGRDGTLVALDKMTGKTIWKSQVPGSPGPAYASAIAVDFEGIRQYVQFTQNTLVGIAAADGKFLWRYDRAANRNGINISTAIYQDGYVFAASAYGAGGGLLKLGKDAGGGVKATEVYFTPNMQNHHGGMIVVDNCLYGANGGNNGGFLVCLDFMTGKILWDQRANRGIPKGSIAMADGRLYYRTENGTMLLIEPSAKQYIERGRFEQPDRSQAPDWSHPVIANGKLYLRDQDVLLCYDVKATRPAAP